MRSIFIIIALLLIISCKTTSTSPQNSAANKAPTKFISHDIGNNNSVTLPAKMAFKAYPMPKLVNIGNMVNYRAETQNSKLAITGFALSAKDKAFSQKQSMNAAKVGAMQYKSQASNPNSEAVDISEPNKVASYIKYNCKSNKPCYPVFGFGSKPWQSVIVAHIQINNMMYTISAGYDTFHSTEEIQIIEALKSIKTN